MVTPGTLVVSPLSPSKVFSKRESGYENKMQKYVVPALRHKKKMCATKQKGILGMMLVPYATEVPPRIVPQEKVKPMFRTPCQYLDKGQ